MYHPLESYHVTRMGGHPSVILGHQFLGAPLYMPRKYILALKKRGRELGCGKLHTLLYQTEITNHHFSLFLFFLSPSPTPSHEFREIYPSRHRDFDNLIPYIQTENR